MAINPLVFICTKKEVSDEQLFSVHRTATVVSHNWNVHDETHPFPTRQHKTGLNDQARLKNAHLEGHQRPQERYSFRLIVSHLMV